PLFDARLLQGLDDTLELLHDALQARDDSTAALETFRLALAAARARPPLTLAEAATCLQDMQVGAEALALDAEASAPDEHEEPDAAALSDVAFWLQALRAQCRDASATLQPFATWTPTKEHTDQQAMPTLRQLAQSGSAGPHDDTRHAMQQHAAAMLQTIEQLAQLAGALALMDYSFLYDTQRDLLSIGYNVDERRLDAGFYDLLASEARLTNFV
ncbi:Cellobiose phosphorylase, partial [mine drainage metagenome]